MLVMMSHTRTVSLILLICAVGFGSGCEDPNSSPSSAEQMSEGHEGDTPTATEATREPTVPVETKEVTYAEMADGSSVTGYHAVPANADSMLSARGLDTTVASLPGIVVIHEWWGLNDNIRAAARRLAGEGYRVLAVDLYGGAVAETPDNAQSLMKEATSSPDQLIANLQGAHEYLEEKEGAPRVAVLGWCFGGGMTFRAVADRPTAFDAAVAYYGTPEAMTTDVLDKLNTPVLAHFGRTDEVVSTDQVEALQSRLEGRDANVQIHQYDAGHAFANPSGEQYDAEAAQNAWMRTTDFLRTHLYATE